MGSGHSQHSHSHCQHSGASRRRFVLALAILLTSLTAVACSSDEALKTTDVDGSSTEIDASSEQPTVSGDDHAIAVEDLSTEERANRTPPAGSLVDLGTGTDAELASEVGSGLTLLWFWSPESSTASRETVVVQRFADRFGPSLDVVAIGSGGERAQADAFVTDSGLEVPTLWSAEADAAEYYGVEELPGSVLVDGDGNIIGRWEGLPEEVYHFVERIS